MKKNRITDVSALRKLMIDRGYKTIGELAKDSDISRNTLGKLLGGQIQPSADIMSKLVNILSISPQEAGSIFFNF